MTFSLLGRCGQTGQLGMVVSSSSPAVAARCAHVRARVGVAASQNVTDPRLGPVLLDALPVHDGDAAATLRAITARTPHLEHRQLVLLGAGGPPAAHTGAAALGIHGHRLGEDCAAAGNLLADPGVLEAMVGAFVDTAGDDLTDRLLAGLRAALDAGGEAGPVHSAGLLVSGEVEWPIVDLRVDWDDDPFGELVVAWAVYKPQVDDYVTRALDPTAAPGYGVAGE